MTTAIKRFETTMNIAQYARTPTPIGSLIVLTIFPENGFTFNPSSARLSTMKLPIADHNALDSALIEPSKVTIILISRLENPIMQLRIALDMLRSGGENVLIGTCKTPSQELIPKEANLFLL